MWVLIVGGLALAIADYPTRDACEDAAKDIGWAYSHMCLKATANARVILKGGDK